jgi:16S rRNA (uracil1498-N3)-methyltransferase
MHIPRLYIQQALVENETLELSKQAAHHIATVMRMKAGRNVILFNGQLHNGKTGEFKATLAYVDKKNVCVAIGEFSECQTESPLQSEIGVCLIKNDRMDWLLQKATELGVSKISPLWSEYTDVKIPTDRLEKKLHHWQQVVINACEQCGRTSVPEILPPKKLREWVDSASADKKIILHPYDNDSHQGETASASPLSVALLVGPEGGFSENEFMQATQQGFQGMTLGSRILRAETAPLAALALMQAKYGDI